MALRILPVKWETGNLLQFILFLILMHNILMKLDQAITGQLEEALRAPSPRGRLQKLMAQMLEKGYERGDLLPALEAFQARLEREGRDEDAGLILEIIDGFTGWCMTC